MEKLLKTLNEKQKEAVLAKDGPILIIAGAGSGKTMVLTSKIAYLILHHKLKPEHILAVTFTNKAATEMKERVFRILKGLHTSHLDALSIGTFHSICLKILRQYADICGYQKNFVIFDDKDQTSLVKSIVEELQINTKQFAPEVFLSHISKLKSKLISVAICKEQAIDFFPNLVSQVYEKYQQTLLEHNAVDFDDMIGLCVDLFKHNKNILEAYQNKFKYILIDEYQDTNYAQYQLITLLAQRYKNICTV